MKVKTSPFITQFAKTRNSSVPALQEEYYDCCIDFAGDLAGFVPGSRLAYFDNLAHPAWKFHAAMEYDGWVHDLWYPLLPLSIFMAAIGANDVEYPATLSPPSHINPRVGME